MLVQKFVERLRPLAGIESWDYILLWKLTDDHRHLELVDCICAGTQNVLKDGEELVFPASSCRPCRDVLYPHARMTACDLLDHVPSSVTLDSGIHADALLSNQSCWLNFSYNSDMNPSEETIGTRVLVPVPIGLLELFVTKQVPEDQVLNDFIKTQCKIFLENQPITNQGCMHSSDSNLQCEPQMSSDPSLQNSDMLLPHDISIDRIHLSNNSPADSLQHFGSGSEFMNKSNGVFVGGNYILDPFSSSCENTFNEMEASQHNMNEKVSFTEENNKSDDSDPNDEDENDGKYRKRSGKGHQSKNLEAERKRRKKLNDRLYKLRALVPNISKLDRSAILGDAIDYVKELQKQVKELQLELEEHSDDENNPATRNDMPYQNGMKSGPKREHDNFPSGFHKGSSSNSGVSTFKHPSETECLDEKVQQMEPQVEVYQLDGNEFYVKVFCEHKTGGFVRLMEALDYLGLEISNVNVTRHTCLVSNVFKVEIKESENVHAEYVKESLLELTRNPLRAWPSNISPVLHDQSTYDTIHLPHHY